MYIDLVEETDYRVNEEEMVWSGLSSYYNLGI